MTQLLQARGWYGVFLHQHPLEPLAEADTIVERAALDLRIRPLVGWSSVEGGWQGLYYYERICRLATPTHIQQTEVNPCWLLGDICQDETTDIRALLMHGVLEHARSLTAELQQSVTRYDLGPRLLVLLDERRIPIPKE